MYNEKKLDMLISVLKERSEEKLTDALKHTRNYLNSYEGFVYENEINYLLEKYSIEEDLPF